MLWSVVMVLVDGFLYRGIELYLEFKSCEFDILVLEFIDYGLGMVL